MFGYSLGPLFVGILFKCIRDEWDMYFCRNIVLGGLVLMNLSMVTLLLIDNVDSGENNLVYKKEDKQLKSDVGSGFFNKVLMFLLIHKAVSSFSLMGTR